MDSYSFLSKGCLCIRTIMSTTKLRNATVIEVRKTYDKLIFFVFRNNSAYSQVFGMLMKVIAPSTINIKVMSSRRTSSWG